MLGIVSEKTLHIAQLNPFDQQQAMMRGDFRRPHGGLRSMEGVVDGHGLMFAAVMLIVVAAAIVAGLFIGVHFGKSATRPDGGRSSMSNATWR